MNYLISGIIIMTVFQSALNNSMNTIEDISSGFMKEILVSPISRRQISIGQILSSSAIALLQGLIVILMGLYLATLAKSSTTFQIMISVVVMPLTFLSGAYIPTTIIPSFLRPIVYINPLTYTTSIFRFITLKMENLPSTALVKAGVAFDVNGFVITPYIGLLIVLVIGFVFFSLCVNQFNKADFSRIELFKGGRGK